MHMKAMSFHATQNKKIWKLPFMLLSRPPPQKKQNYISLHIFCNRNMALIQYVQISVRPHNSVRAAIVKIRRLTTRDHSKKLPVDLLLLLSNRLLNKEKPQYEHTDMQQIDMKDTHSSLLLS